MASRLPRKLSSSPSTIIWTISGPRLAPRALRTASSFCRSMARDSIRFARFAQASSRISPTAPSSTSRFRRSSLPTSSTIHRKNVDAAKARVERGILLFQRACRLAPFRAAPAPAKRRAASARTPVSCAGSGQLRCAGWPVRKESRCRACAARCLRASRADGSAAGSTPTTV